MVNKTVVGMATGEAEIRGRSILRSFHRRAFPAWHIDPEVAAGQEARQCTFEQVKQKIDRRLMAAIASSKPV